MAKLVREYKVDPSTVKRWVVAWETEQRLDPLARGTTNYDKMELAHLLYLQYFLEKDPTRYIWELRSFMSKDLEGAVDHPWLSKNTIWRLVKDDLGFSHKKVSNIIYNS